MITHEEISIERALEHEQRTMQRQTLLKKLWKLQLSRAENEKITTDADESDGQARRHARTLTILVP